MVRYPRPGSALERVLDPDAHVTPEAMFLRDLAFMVRRFLGGDGEPVPLTEAEREALREARGTGADLMTPEQAMARLGLAPRRKEVSDGR